MNQQHVSKPELKLVGLTVRTSNKNEMSPDTAKIGGLFAAYWGQGAPAQISARKTPGVTYSVYTEYASNEHGDYTYFLGEEVSSFDNIPAGMQQLTIPASKYQKFTTQPGQMPSVVIQAWQHIWEMTPADLNGERAYIADFEVYDERASDLSKAVVDIYIGVR